MKTFDDTGVKIDLEQHQKNIFEKKDNIWIL